jgi:hypothetical protein
MSCDLRNAPGRGGPKLGSERPRSTIQVAQNFVTKKDERPVGDSCEKELTITDLTRAIEDLASRKKKPEDLEGIIAEAQELARRWKVAKRPVLEGYSSQPLVVLLTALVVELREDQDFASLISWFPPMLEVEPARQSKYEAKRRRNRWDRVGEIVRQFDGSNFWRHLAGDIPPDYLAALFRCETVTMTQLETLFGMDRHRFPRKLTCVREGKRTWYDLRAFLEIMDALLTEPRHKKQKRGSPRRVWLIDSDLRKRVLNGMILRAHSVCADKHLARAFEIKVKCHLPDSGKK